MSDNLPAVVHSEPTREIATMDTDSWTGVFSDVVELARGIADTEFVPRGLRGSIPATTAAILYGREIGLPPMTSLNSTHVIEGKPSISAEAMRARVLAAGHEIEVLESTGAICRMRARRRGTDRWTPEVVWSIDMAQAAGLTGKNNWKNHPRRMLQARASSELCELYFPDVVMGFRSVEEMRDEADVDENAEAPATPGTRVTRKRTAKKAAASKPAPAAERPAEQPDSGPPLPGEPGYEEGEASTPAASDERPAAGESVDGSDDGATASHAAGTGNDDEDPSTDDIHDAVIVTEGTDTTTDEPAVEVDDNPAPRLRSERQKKMLFAVLEGLDVEDDERHAIASQLLGRPISSFNEITYNEAKTFIDTLAHIKTRADLDVLLERTTGGEQS